MKKLVWLVLVLGLSLALAACGDASGESVDGGPLEEEFADPTTAEQVTIDSVDAFGVVSAKKDVAISVDFNARVETVHVQAGEKVTEGMALVDFDISELNNELNSKKRDLEFYQKKLGQKNYDATKMSYDLEVAKEELETQERQFNGKESLYNSGAISKDEFDGAEDAIVAKRNAVKNMQLSLSTTYSNVSNNNLETK